MKEEDAPSTRGIMANSSIEMPIIFTEAAETNFAILAVMRILLGVQIE